MKQSTHIIISVGIGLLLLNIYNAFIRLGIMYFFLGILFGIIGKVNDYLDHKLYTKHERKFLTHSPLSPLLICISIFTGAFFMFLDLSLGIYLIFIFHTIFVMHFLLDALNPSGVPTYPKKRLYLNHIPYDSVKWNFIFFFTGLFLTIIAIHWFILLV